MQVCTCMCTFMGYSGIIAELRELCLCSAGWSNCSSGAVHLVILSQGLSLTCSLPCLSLPVCSGDLPVSVSLAPGLQVHIPCLL